MNLSSGNLLSASGLCIDWPDIKLRSGGPSTTISMVVFIYMKIYTVGLLTALMTLTFNLAFAQTSNGAIISNIPGRQFAGPRHQSL